MSTITRWLVTGFMAFVPLSVEADFTGKVTGITDGDTIEVLDGTDRIKVRLDGVDAPERKQPFGTRARQFVAGQCFGQTVTVQQTDTDRYGRAIGVVVLDGGATLNQEIVENGLAWWYREYAPDNQSLARAELEARKAKKGLWSEPHPVAPWEWRDGRRKGSTVEPPHLVSNLPVLGGGAARDAAVQQSHWMTSSTRTRHNSTCRYFKTSKGRPCGANEGVACKICGG